MLYLQTLFWKSVYSGLCLWASFFFLNLNIRTLPISANLCIQFHGFELNIATCEVKKKNMCKRPSACSDFWLGFGTVLLKDKERVEDI